MYRLTIKCQQCKMTFTVDSETILSAVDKVHEEGCPMKCQNTGTLILLSHETVSDKNSKMKDLFEGVLRLPDYASN